MIDATLHKANREAHKVARASLELREWVRQLSRATQDPDLCLHPDARKLFHDKVTESGKAVRAALAEYEEAIREGGDVA